MFALKTLFPFNGDAFNLISSPTFGNDSKLMAQKTTVLERYLHALVRILDDVLEHPDRADRAVINMSFRVQMAWVPEGPYGEIMGEFISMPLMPSIRRDDVLT
jgi:hypothetical protein